MTNLGLAMSGVNHAKGRREHDLYETPPDAAGALLESGVILPGLTVWEPACGTGKLVSELERRGWPVIATDYFDHGFGRSRIHDFTHTELGAAQAPLIITNPPFNLAREFIQTALSLMRNGEVLQIALLLKAQYWNAQRRFELLDRYPPTWWMPICWRIDFTGQGDSTMDVCWAVWTYGCPHIGFKPLTKPKALL